jgi:hypothetical protein
VLVLDLKEHDQDWVRARFGNQRLGFSREALEALLGAAGLKDIRVTTGARKRGDPFTILVASGIKPPGPRPLRPRPQTVANQ